MRETSKRSRLRKHLPCSAQHVPNVQTANFLRESMKEKEALSFQFPFDMFKYLGLPTTFINKNSQKNLKG